MGERERVRRIYKVLIEALYMRFSHASKGEGVSYGEATVEKRMSEDKRVSLQGDSEVEYIDA